MWWKSLNIFCSTRSLNLHEIFAGLKYRFVQFDTIFLLADAKHTAYNSTALNDIQSFR